MTRQHRQVYGNQHGPPLGRPGNGLGDVWGHTGDPEDGHPIFKSRTSDKGSYGPDEEPEELEPPDHTPEILLAISALTPKQRFVVELRFGLRSGGGEYTLTEIADLMGVSFQAVSRIEIRALASLAERLKNVVEGGEVSSSPASPRAASSAQPSPSQTDSPRRPACP